MKRGTILLFLLLTAACSSLSCAFFDKNAVTMTTTTQYPATATGGYTS